MASENIEHVGFYPNPLHHLARVWILENRGFVDFANPATAAVRDDSLDSQREMLTYLDIRYVRHRSI